MSAYQSFLELPEEKRLRIINAGLKQFGIHGYQKANTEEIARDAGISKGLLFYYFKNKEQFYLYLCDFCKRVFAASIDTEEYIQITDFFELLDLGIRSKAKLIAQYPYISDFSMNAYYAQNEKTSGAVNKYIKEELDASFSAYFQHIDVHRFKEEIDPKKIYQMLTWMSEGYLMEKKRGNEPISFDEVTKEFQTWSALLRKISYKKEYLI